MLCQRLSSSFGEDTQWPLIEAEGSENLDTSAATQNETFADKYVTLNQIGNGAFGSVYTAYKTSDKLLVVTKFIQKSKVCQGCHEMWVECGKHGERIPLEVSLLLTLKHPGIVNVIDVFQNESFVQMVMEKHGDMDLYEFIERKPKMNEALASLIFRQVVSAVGFLHSREILHRDIKDENIVIDHNFQCRLIDFGSATFFKPGQLFSRFYGTLEYCSPEVLRGHPYRGPELEVWSLGVLLYTLMYGVNPFSSPEDTMLAKIYFSPFKDVSAVFKDLIEACLEADPSRRASLWYIRGHRFLNIPASFDDFRFSDVIPCKQSELDPPTHYQENPCHISENSDESKNKEKELEADDDAARRKKKQKNKDEPPNKRKKKKNKENKENKSEAVEESAGKKKSKKKRKNKKKKHGPGGY